MTIATLPYRTTPQRAAILRVVRAADDHPTAREIYERVRGERPGIGFATVYRTLDLLVAHGEVAQLQIGEDQVARYDGDVSRHDHVRCTACGAIDDLHAQLPAELTAAMHRSAEAAGYAIDGYELTLHGRCRTCGGA